jgi:magnesium-transporting ATPase (P-type)
VLILLFVCVVCIHDAASSAHFVQSEDNAKLPIADREVLGDATETALLRYTAAATDVDGLRKKFSYAVEVPFSSDRKWAAGAFNKSHSAGVYTVYLKVCKRLYRIVMNMSFLALYSSCGCINSGTALCSRD